MLFERSWKKRDFGRNPYPFSWRESCSSVRVAREDVNEEKEEGGSGRKAKEIQEGVNWTLMEIIDKMFWRTLKELFDGLRLNRIYLLSRPRAAAEKDHCVYLKTSQQQ